MVVFNEETEPRLLANDPTLTSLSLRSSELMGISNVSHRVGRAIASTTHLTTLELDLKVYHDDLTLLIENQEGLSETALQETAIFLSSSSTLESLFMTTVLDEEAHKSTSVAGVFMFALNDRISRGYGP
jgi:hypothetical protein